MPHVDLSESGRYNGSICKPLTTLLKKNQFVWTLEATKAFQALKETMISPLVLALPDFSEEFIVKTDVLGIGIGVVLMQKGHSIAFINKTLSPKHQALSVYEKELLAIVYVVTMASILEWKTL